MAPVPPLFLLTLSLLISSCYSYVYADDAAGDNVVKAAAMNAGKISSSEKKLFSQSIRTTKESVAREALDVFYRDAVEAYNRGNYDEALELLNNVYSVDPYFEDVATLRETITRLKYSKDVDSKRGILDDYMRKGNAADQAGQSVAAIGFWKQALTVNSAYVPAKRKIKEANRKLAQKQYEAGYLYYHHGDLEEALDSWSNAIALDPSFKQRGLLMLMSKVQLAQRKDQIARLSSQAAQFYADKNYPEALHAYEQLLVLDSRNDEARRMAGKIKVQLGMSAYKSARDAMAQKQYAQAIKRWQESIQYGYEVQKSQRGIQDAERQIQSTQDDRINKRNAKTAATTAPPGDGTAASEPAPPVVPAVQRPPANPEEANKHYRQGLAAIRGKDYHRAVQELEIASQLNPEDEHIYVAKERAKQEWRAANAQPQP